MATMEQLLQAWREECATTPAEDRISFAEWYEIVWLGHSVFEE